MISLCQLRNGLKSILLGQFLFCTFSGAVFAAAPVVDESQNYTILDNQSSNDEEQPIARNMPASAPNSELEYGDEPEQATTNSQPLAHESKKYNISDNASLLNRLQTLEQEVQELRGQLEIQNHTVKTLKEQQLSFYKDLDSRINASNTSKAAPKTVFAPTLAEPVPKNTIAEAPAQAAHNTNPADEQVQYLAAYDLITTKHYEEATTAMQNFATNFPQSGYTPNAEYWLGELFLMQKNYPKAINHFQTVLQRFPTSSKSAPSLLKIGYALNADGKRAEAIVNLKQVIQQFPDTPSAKLAQKKLNTLII